MLQHLFWYLRLIKTHTSPSTAASRWLSWLENSCQGLGLLQCALRSPTCLGPGLGVGKVRAPDWYAFFFFLMLIDQASELICMCPRPDGLILGTYACTLSQVGWQGSRSAWTPARRPKWGSMHFQVWGL